MTKIHFSDEWIEGIAPAPICMETYVPLINAFFDFDESVIPPAFSYRWHVDYAKVIERVDIPDADFILFPFIFNRGNLVESHPVVGRFREVAETARASGKDLVVQYELFDEVGAQSVFLSLLPEVVALSTNLVLPYATTRARCIPYFIRDALKTYFPDRWQPGPCREKPVVGFCGTAGPLGTKWGWKRSFDFMRLALTYLEFAGVDTHRLAETFGTNMKHAHRARQLLMLKHHQEIDLRVILRSEGGLVSNLYFLEDRNDAFFTEYFDNMFQSDYVLASRGTENYSLRFYEALCLGRIPVLVESHGVLPFEHLIDYDSHCVVIPLKKIHQTADLILQFHRRHTAAQLAELQRKNRELWEEYLSPLGYWKNILLEPCFHQSPKG